VIFEQPDNDNTVKLGKVWTGKKWKSFWWADKMVWFRPCKNRESFVPVVVSCLNIITLYCEINWRHCLCKHFAIFWEFVKHNRVVNEG
jgi:hypothetical protein